MYSQHNKHTLRFPLAPIFGMILAGTSHAADNLADAEDTPFNTWVTESNQAATSEPAEPTAIGYKTIWRKFTTTQRCIVTVKTPESPPIGIFHRLTVFRGNSYDALNLIETNRGVWGGTSVSFPAEKGMTFRVCLGSDDDDDHANMIFAVLQSTWPYGTKAVVPPPAPTTQIVPNDSFETARKIPASDVLTTVFGSLGSATTQPNEGDDITGTHAVWYTWKAPFAGTLRLTTPPIPNNPGFDRRVSVFTGVNPTALTSVTTQNSGSIDLTFAIQANTTYAIALGFEHFWSSFGEKPFSFVLELSPLRFHPDIEVRSSDGRVLVDGSAKLDLGKAKVRRNGRSQTLLIRNKGKAPLTGLIVKKTGKASSDFTTTSIYPRTIDPGGAGSFEIRFKPRKKGPRNATIRIISNDPDESPFDIKLTGKGVK